MPGTVHCAVRGLFPTVTGFPPCGYRRDDCRREELADPYGVNRGMIVLVGCLVAAGVIAYLGTQKGKAATSADQAAVAASAAATVASA
ncbi:MAG TPA: hypothetical protein VN697_12240, partial [Tepidiformaceae bacterium]|nr:hypothetical protein [Tepidiformaceae bacterium]